MRAKDDAMVEQVASAIAIEDTGVSWHDVSPRDRTYYVRLARAALAAQPAPSAPVGVLAQRIEAYHWDIADKPVAAQFAAELRSLAQQPAAVADATVARLTKDQRTRLVEKLVADQVEGADRMSSYLWSVLKNGFKGYNNYTDQELLDAHWDAFDEDFFGLESGDDQ